MVATTDKMFAGSIPELYERFLVPLIFESYALDLAGRLAKANPSDVLETAAGTGVLTRAMASALPAPARIVGNRSQPADARSCKARQAWRRAGSSGGRPTRWRCRSRIAASMSWLASSA